MTLQLKYHGKCTRASLSDFVVEKQGSYSDRDKQIDAKQTKSPSAWSMLHIDDTNL